MLPAFGWCNKIPLRAPAKCRQCGKPMKLIRGRVVTCQTCDETEFWPRGRRANERRRR